MASTLRVVCDRCGDEVLRDRVLLTVESGPLRTYHPSFDLCAECAAELVNWMKVNRRPSPAPALALALALALAQPERISRR